MFSLILAIDHLPTYLLNSGQGGFVESLRQRDAVAANPTYPRVSIPVVVAGPMSIGIQGKSGDL
jgi:hypothetical protein